MRWACYSCTLKMFFLQQCKNYKNQTSFSRIMVTNVLPRFLWITTYIYVYCRFRFVMGKWSLLGNWFRIGNFACLLRMQYRSGDLVFLLRRLFHFWNMFLLDLSVKLYATVSFGMLSWVVLFQENCITCRCLHGKGHFCGCLADWKEW